MCHWHEHAHCVRYGLFRCFNGVISSCEDQRWNFLTVIYVGWYSTNQAVGEPIPVSCWRTTHFLDNDDPKRIKTQEGFQEQMEVQSKKLVEMKGPRTAEVLDREAAMERRVETLELQ
jgi:hypothetical protein